jgi:hypothetical protein
MTILYSLTTLGILDENFGNVSFVKGTLGQYLHFSRFIIGSTLYELVKLHN